MNQPSLPPDPQGRNSGPSAPKAGKASFLALGAGLLLPFLAIGALYWWNKDNLSLRAAQERLGPLALQSANLGALEEELNAYRRALTLPPCKMPPRPGEPLPVPARPAETPEKPTSLSSRPPVKATEAEAGESQEGLVERATVFVLVPEKNDIGSGTGFFVAPNIVLTNLHVVQSIIDGRGGQALVTNKALGQAVKARLLQTTPPGSLRDYALLEVTPPPGTSPAVLPVTAEIKRSDHISAWGYPFLVTESDPRLKALMEGDLASVPEVVYSEGVVSVIQDIDGLPVINHTAEVSHGSSGGPLVNSQGQVVGINTLIRVDERSNRQVNIALGGRDIIDYAASNGLNLDVR